MYHRSRTKESIFKLGAAALLVGFVALPAHEPSPVSQQPAHANMAHDFPTLMVASIAAPLPDAPSGQSLSDKFRLLLLDPQRMELPAVETTADLNIRTLMNHEHFQL